MGGNTQQLRQLCEESGGSRPSKIEATSHVLFPSGEDGRTRPDRTRVGALRFSSRIPISIGANGGDMETTGLEATLKNAADSKELLSELFTK